MLPHRAWFRIIDQPWAWSEDGEFPTQAQAEQYIDDVIARNPDLEGLALPLGETPFERRKKRKRRRR